MRSLAAAETCGRADESVPGSATFPPAIREALRAMRLETAHSQGPRILSYERSLTGCAAGSHRERIAASFRGPMSNAATSPAAHPLPRGFFPALIFALVMVDALIGYLAWEAARTFL
jgi:hypothetical protein